MQNSRILTKIRYTVNIVSFVQSYKGLLYKKEINVSKCNFVV